MIADLMMSDLKQRHCLLFQQVVPCTSRVKKAAAQGW
jgi:hypothetical protein